MSYNKQLMEFLKQIIGKKLDAINLACEMMMFSFEEFELHAQCLVRIIYNNDILVTTLDYQSWDGKTEENNDEWYFVEQYRTKIVGGIVITAEITSLNDLVIILDNGIRIELFIKNGYHHFDDEAEQWVFFKRHDHSHPFVTAYSKTVNIALEW